ncbi:MAG: sulfatase-like hydrolase/transferase [Acidobacteria bacterium]|nr:sulfatase-like hydrolase/transferase [Acidobacteriota bacterium]
MFLLVFDEFTLYALLGQDGQIDPSRFPNFKQMAAQSYWFRNATANSNRTALSIPTILTGNFPDRRLSPIEAHYPSNLFNLLQPYYESYVYESFTHFCRPEVLHCLSAPPELRAGGEGLLQDVFQLYLLRVLPTEVSRSVPIGRTDWVPLGVWRMTRARVQEINRVLAAIRSTGQGENIFFFAHFELPHAPYLLTSEGQRSELSPVYFTPGPGSNRRVPRSQAEQYRSQVGFVDGQLGRFLTQLKRQGLYDKSLIIITADHGISLKPGAGGRGFTVRDGKVINADHILTVPLFIKLPFQKQGMVSDRDVQLIDITPTVAHLLGLRIPWDHVGRSVFDGPQPVRAKVAYDERGNRFELPQDVGLAGLKVEWAPSPPIPEGTGEKGRPEGKGNLPEEECNHPCRR